MKRLLHLFRKELIELRRDPRLFGIVIIAPIVQLTLLAYAATTDVRDVPVMVMDQDQSSREPGADRAVRRVRELHCRGRGDVDAGVGDGAEHPDRVDGADDSATTTATALRAASPTTVQIVADGTDANSTNVALGYAGALISGYAAELAAAAGRAAPGRSCRPRCGCGSTRSSRAGSS